MQLNQTTDYAVQTAVFLAMEQRTVSSQEISKAMNIPQTYILKFTKILEEAGIVEVYRGVNGGIQLKNWEVTLLDIIRAMERSIKINRCLEEDGWGNCPAWRVYAEVQDFIEEKLGGTKLRELAGVNELNIANSRGGTGAI